MAEPGTSLPIHPKVRRILVESKSGQGQEISCSALENSSYSRNSTTTSETIRCEKSINSSSSSSSSNSASGGSNTTLSYVGASATSSSSSATRKKSQSQSSIRGLTHRAPSPVLTQSSRRGTLSVKNNHNNNNNNNNNSSDRNKLSPIKRSSIPKSASVPAIIEQQQLQTPPISILKRSSSFLAAKFENPKSFCSLILRRRTSKKNKNLSAASSESQKASPRKCVSFSSDTSFTERDKRFDSKLKKTALHEAKQYRKGVLQAINCCADRNGCEDKFTTDNHSISWDNTLGGPKALLGAAHDGDDELIKKILTNASKVGPGSIDVNALDSSGRTAISYMAGNGSALMLEACLTFPGTDVNLPDNEGNTPLHFAAQAGQTECLNILLQRCPSIEVDARNSLGFTPLMKAALQGRTKCAKILLFAGANPTLRDHGRGLRAEQWARFCGRYVCAEVIERFARHRLLEKTTSCRWGSEPELAAQVLQGKLMAIPSTPVQPAQSSGLKSKIRRVFRTSSNNTEKNFSLVSQLTSAALCASSPVLPKPGDVSPAVKSLLRPLSVPQLRITLVSPQDIIEKTNDKCDHSTSFTEKIESTMVKPPRMKKKNK